MKNFLLFAFSILTITAFAQNAPVDFEPAGIGTDFTWATFEAPPMEENPTFSIVTNVLIDANNPSETVAKMDIAYATNAGWGSAGCETMHGSDIGPFTITTENNMVSLQFYQVGFAAPVALKFATTDGAAFPEVVVQNTIADAWVTVEFDMSVWIGSTLPGILDQVIFFPSYAPRATGHVVYFDNITFGEQVQLPSPMVAAPDPTIDEVNVISMFSNVYTDVTVDTWQTPWSAGILSDIQIQGNDTKKYTNLEFVGIETTGANLIDATEMQFFHFDVWTPNMANFRVKLVDFGADGGFDGGDDSEHEIEFEGITQGDWISYMIPLTDFVGLTAQNNMAQLIFSGTPAGEGVVYIDNVYFSKDPVSTNELAIADFKIFPNPAQTDLKIETDAQVEKVEIYNTIGQLMISEINESQLDIKGLSNGSYFVVVTIDGQKRMEKLIKN
ncbi:MAG: hypothetical protein ACI9XO_003995 [Paraglaciecola sp.]|jgi:hypothetical protein